MSEVINKFPSAPENSRLSSVLFPSMNTSVISTCFLNLAKRLFLQTTWPTFYFAWNRLGDIGIYRGHMNLLQNAGRYWWSFPICSNIRKQHSNAKLAYEIFLICYIFLQKWAADWCHAECSRIGFKFNRTIILKLKLELSLTDPSIDNFF